MKSTEQAMTGNEAPAAARPKHRRRTIVVKKGFQFKYGIIMFLLFGLSAFMVWWENYQSISALVENGFIRDPGTMMLLDKISHAVFAKTCFALILVWCLSLLLSHYLAGPIYRIEACLRSLREGDLTVEAHLRAHDELKDVAGVYNEAIGNIRTAVGEDRERIRALREKLASLGSRLSGAERNELQQIANALGETHRFFKTEPGDGQPAGPNGRA